MPLFSIIIPTYNSAKTVQECLDSILSQSFIDFEIIVMDGISVDGTLDILKQYEDERVLVKSEKDKNVYDAMNKGIEISKGEWLLFLGSDDKIYDTEVLANISEYLASNECDVVYGDAFFVGRNYFHDGAFTREKLFNEKNICHQAIFYNKAVFNRLGHYNLNYPINADWDFNLRCFSTPDLKINYINLPIVVYNDVSGLSDSGNPDVNFHKVSGAKLNKNVSALNAVIRQKEEYIHRLETSKSYRIGNFILYPFKLLRRIFNF